MTVALKVLVEAYMTSYKTFLKEYGTEAAETAAHDMVELLETVQNAGMLESFTAAVNSWKA